MRTRLFGISLAALLAACSSQHAGLQITPVGEESARPNGHSLIQAQILLSRGEYALAIEDYRKAVRYDPTDAVAYNGLAISYDGVGRFDLSRRYYELALARAPREGKYYRNFALSLKRQGKADQAAQVLAQMERATASRIAEARPAPPTLRTLADIARDGVTSIADAASHAIRPHLERLSMGEVLLSTKETTDPVRAARSITVPIPAVETRQSAQNSPLADELAARPVGSSITIELPETEPLMREEPLVELAGSLPPADIPLAELTDGQAEIRPGPGAPIIELAAPAELMAAVLHLGDGPGHGCEAPVTAPAYEAAAIGDASLAVFLGDFAPARLGRSGSIELPLIYQASVNLPLPSREAVNAPACAVRMARGPDDKDALLSLLWQDPGGIA